MIVLTVSEGVSIFFSIRYHLTTLKRSKTENLNNMTMITMLKHEYYIVNTSKNVKTQEKKTKIKKLGVEIGLFFTYNIYSI